MARGDHIKVHRPAYWHHGIDIGDQTVIHFTGEISQKADAEIKRTSLKEFLDRGKLTVVEYAKCFEPDEVIRRAFSCIGDREYNLLLNNCEHFACWCKTGNFRSEQARDTTTTVGASAGIGTAAMGSISAVTAVRVASGVTGGAGIMAGLAAIGVGGAIGGLLTLASAPAVVANIAVHQVYQDDEHLPESERDARQAARISAKAGTVAGAAGTVGTISAVGTVAGLSGAGITSGLAAIGSIVGGGMAAGVVISVAAPAVVAAAASFGVYQLWKMVKK
jgi:hypothetical protein